MGLRHLVPWIMVVQVMVSKVQLLAEKRQAVHLLVVVQPIQVAIDRSHSQTHLEFYPTKHPTTMFLLSRLLTAMVYLL